MSVKNGLVQLENLTSMEKLSVDEVMGLIKRASAFKAGTAEFDLEKQTLLQIFSLKILQERTIVSILLSVN